MVILPYNAADQSKDHGALSLLGDGLRIDHVTVSSATVTRLTFTTPFGFTVTSATCAQRLSVKIANSDAAPAAFWQRLAPIALLGGGIQHLEPVRLASRSLRRI